MTNYGSFFLITIASLLLVSFIYVAWPIFQIGLSFFGKVFVPFLISLLISYLLHPIIKVLTERLNMHRTSAIVVVFILLISVVATIIYHGLPVLVLELQDLLEQLPELVLLYEAMSRSLYESISFLPEALHIPIDSIMLNVEQSVEGFIDRLVDRALSLFDDFIRYLMIPVLVFYMLKDERTLRDYFYHFVPDRYEKFLRHLFEDVHEAFGHYVRAQLLLSFFITVLSLLLFQLIGLKYAFVLSVFMGVMNIIPYFGPIIGTIPAATIALATSWQLVFYVIVIAIVVQLIESSLLSPYIMGKTANLHPIVIILILLVSSEIGGIIAMLLAIPLVMVVRAAIVSILRQKEECVDN